MIEAVRKPIRYVSASMPIAVTVTLITDSIAVRVSKKCPAGPPSRAKAVRAKRIAPQTKSSAPSQKGKNPGPAWPSTHFAPTWMPWAITAAEKPTMAMAIKICAFRMAAPCGSVLEQAALGHQVLVERLRLLQPLHEVRPSHELRPD